LTRLVQGGRPLVASVIQRLSDVIFQLVPVNGTPFNDMIQYDTLYLRAPKS